MDRSLKCPESAERTYYEPTCLGLKVTDRSGCGLTEFTILQVVSELAGNRRGEAGCAEVLTEIDRHIALGPSYAYPMMCDLATPWVISAALLKMNGGPGDRLFPQPTPAEHSECRLSRVGKLVMAAESGQIAPVPVGLVNGTWWRGAIRPSLDPFRLITVLRQLIDDPGLSDDRLLQIVGRPESLTGSELMGDFGALALGKLTTIREAPRITRTDTQLIIDAAPSHLSAPRLNEEISGQIYPEDWQPPVPPPDSKVRVPEQIRNGFAARALPIARMRDESKHDKIRLVISLRQGADPETVKAQLSRMGALAIDRIAQFPAPLTDLLRTWVATNRHEDISASLNQFRAAVQYDRRKPRS
jgi:hypothetical protein